MKSLDRSGVVKTFLFPKTVIFVLVFFLLALVFRFSTAHHPFWVDEFSTGVQSRMLVEKGLSVFTDKSQYFEYHNITPHFLVALSFTLMGESEFAARLPFMIIGSMVPPLLYVLGKKLFSQTTGICAALLGTFSYFLITWSRQARGYVLQQVIVLLVFLAYFSLLDKLDKKKSIVTPLVSLLVLLVLGLLTHTSLILLAGALCLHFAFFYRVRLIRAALSWQAVLLVVLVAVMGVYTGLWGRILLQLKEGDLANNLGYYHSFLWREYGLITFLGVLGLVLGCIHLPKKMSVFFIYIAAHLFFFSFLFGPYVSRYLLPIFPLFILGMAYAITYIGTAIWKLEFTPRVPLYIVQTLCILVAIGIMANGYKFTIKPKAYYSVNHDFREIALLDYDQVYNLIKSKGKLSEGKTAVIDTWPDRESWYLGSKYPAQYVFRWDQGGIMKQTPYVLNADNEKRVIQREEVGLISEVSDLQQVMKKYPRGFLWIDDTTLPADVIDFAQKNLKKELSIEHYPFDDNPYSVWPATLYSWGVAND